MYYENPNVAFLVYLLQYGTVSVGINPACFNTYHSGVLKDDIDCSCSTLDNNNKPISGHAVTVVGYSLIDYDEDCSGYWIVKDSYGPYVRINGYLYVCIPKDPKIQRYGSCNILEYAEIPDIGLWPTYSASLE